MARLQDFSDVTPSSSSDKLLIVQSAGQGLATLDTAGQQIANNTSVSQLNTTSKTLAGAINEHDSEIGTLSSLTTSVKSSLVGAVNEVNGKANTVTSLGATITKATGVNDFEIGLYQNNKIISGYVAFTFSANPSANATIATGFPIPKGMMQIPVACVYGSNLGKVGRIAINTSGNLQDWYSDTAFFKTGNTYVANLNYLKA